MTEPVAVGLDAVEVPRFARALRDHPRLFGRVFTEGEIADCAGSRNADQRLAARFAAKEAVFKALRCGWPDLSYRDVEVVTAGGAPSLVLRSRAAELARARDIAVSITHTSSIALAEVVMTSREER